MKLIFLLAILLCATTWALVSPAKARQPLLVLFPIPGASLAWLQDLARSGAYPGIAKALSTGQVQVLIPANPPAGNMYFIKHSEALWETQMTWDALTQNRCGLQSLALTDIENLRPLFRKLRRPLQFNDITSKPDLQHLATKSCKPGATLSFAFADPNPSEELMRNYAHSTSGEARLLGTANLRNGSSSLAHLASVLDNLLLDAAIFQRSLMRIAIFSPYRNVLQHPFRSHIRPSQALTSMLAQFGLRNAAAPSILPEQPTPTSQFRYEIRMDELGIHGTTVLPLADRQTDAYFRVLWAFSLSISCPQGTICQAEQLNRVTNHLLSLREKHAPLFVVAAQNSQRTLLHISPQLIDIAKHSGDLPGQWIERFNSERSDRWVRPGFALTLGFSRIGANPVPIENFLTQLLEQTSSD